MEISWLTAFIKEKLPFNDDNQKRFFLSENPCISGVLKNSCRSTFYFYGFLELDAYVVLFFKRKICETSNMQKLVFVT